MSDQLEERLKTLETEFENGRKMLADLEAREATLRSSLLRISGAIQVLREFVQQTDAVPVSESAQPLKSAVIAN